LFHHVAFDLDPLMTSAPFGVIKHGWLAGQDSDEMEVLQSSESHRITPCLIAGSGEPHNSMD